MSQRTKQYTLSRSQPCVSGHQTATCDCTFINTQIREYIYTHICKFIYLIAMLSLLSMMWAKGLERDNIAIFVLSEFLKVLLVEDG